MGSGYLLKRPRSLAHRLGAVGALADVQLLPLPVFCKLTRALRCGGVYVYVYVCVCVRARVFMCVYSRCVCTHVCDLHTPERVVTACGAKLVRAA